MTDFITNLFKGLLIISRVLKAITFDINGSALSLMDTISYACILSIVMSLIKQISYNGLFTINKENREKLEGGVSARE